MGSITIDVALLEASGIVPGEKVQVVNNNNGARIETCIPFAGKRKGTDGFNVVAWYDFYKGDVVIILAYAFVTPDEAKSLELKVVFPNSNNLIEA